MRAYRKNRNDCRTLNIRKTCSVRHNLFVFPKPRFHHSKSVYRRLLSVLSVSLLFLGCSQEPAAERVQDREAADHIRLLEEIPEHVLEVENLTVYPGDSEPMYRMELIPEVRFDDADGPYLFRVLGSVVDDRNQVVVWGTNTSYEQSLHAYTTEGTHLARIGRQGEGPGEYRTIVGLFVKGSTLFVVDATNSRLNEYATADFSVLRSTHIEQWDSGDGYRFGYVWPRSDGHYWLQFTDPRTTLGRLSARFQIMDREGNSVQDPSLTIPGSFRIQVGESMRPIMPLSFLGRTVQTFSGKDELYTAWSQDFLIRRYDANGVYQSAFYYPIRGLPFNLEEHTESNIFSPSTRDIERAFAAIDQELPETGPVVDMLMVDDESRIWAAVPMDGRREMVEWWILEQSGELLAKLQRPVAHRIFDIKDGYLYGKEVDEETGEEVLVKYRMEFRKAR
ncbi:MAG: 6-bladed beta-propeller [Balneolaceae bacterium]